MGMHEEVLHRARADMELGEVDAAVEEGRQLTGAERRLKGGESGHYGITWPNAARPSSKPRAATASGT